MTGQISGLCQFLLPKKVGTKITCYFYLLFDIIQQFNRQKMYFSERQISMAVGRAKLGVEFERILMAVILDRQQERETKPIEKYLEEIEAKKQTTNV